MALKLRDDFTEQLYVFCLGKVHSLAVSQRNENRGNLQINMLSVSDEPYLRTDISGIDQALLMHLILGPTHALISFTLCL